MKAENARIKHDIPQLQEVIKEYKMKIRTIENHNTCMIEGVENIEETRQDFESQVQVQTKKIEGLKEINQTKMQEYAKINLERQQTQVALKRIVAVLLNYRRSETEKNNYKPVEHAVTNFIELKELVKQILFEIKFVEEKKIEESPVKIEKVDDDLSQGFKAPKKVQD